MKPIGGHYLISRCRAQHRLVGALVVFGLLMAAGGCGLSSSSGDQGPTTIEAEGDTSTGSKPAPSDQTDGGRSLVERYGAVVETIDQNGRNEILDIAYDGLAGADRQLWIEVYAAEFVEGFEKSQTGSVSLRPTMTATGDAATDTVSIRVVTVVGELDPSTRPALIELECMSSALRWATGQGLRLHNLYVDSAGTSIEWTLTEELCADTPNP